MTAVDPTLLAMELVRRCSEISAMVGDRIYGAELPAAIQTAMPTSAVVCNAVPSGAGVGIADYLHVKVSRVDIRVYSGTPAAASRIAAAIDLHLHNVRAGKYGLYLVHWTHRVSGPNTYRAAPGDWPVCVYTVDIQHAAALIE